MQHYIIMADVISSRTITKENDFMGQFKQLIEETNTTFASNILSPLTITLGDEFQGVVDSAKTLFKLLFFLSCAIFFLFLFQEAQVAAPLKL
mgnify:CR=1 FL=1